MNKKISLMILYLLMLVFIQLVYSVGEYKDRIEVLGDVELGTYYSDISGEEVDYGYSGMGTKLGTKEETTGKGKLLINLLPEKDGSRIFSASYELKTDPPPNYEGDPEMIIQNWRCSFSTNFDVNKNSIDVAGNCKVCTKQYWYPDGVETKRDYCFTPYTTYIISDNLVNGKEITGSVRSVSPYGSRGPKPYHKFDFKIPIINNDDVEEECTPACGKYEICFDGDCGPNFEDIDCAEVNMVNTDSITSSVVLGKGLGGITGNVINVNKGLLSVTGHAGFDETWGGMIEGVVRGRSTEGTYYAICNTGKTDLGSTIARKLKEWNLERNVNVNDLNPWEIKQLLSAFSSNSFINYLKTIPSIDIDIIRLKRMAGAYGITAGEITNEIAVKNMDLFRELAGGNYNPEELKIVAQSDYTPGYFLREEYTTKEQRDWYISGTSKNQDAPFTHLAANINADTSSYLNTDMKKDNGGTPFFILNSDRPSANDIVGSRVNYIYVMPKEGSSSYKAKRSDNKFIYLQGPNKGQVVSLGSGDGIVPFI